ncbi:hypothetical protein L1987_61653 [Smallanthus sonchifolius]|uniref:Uncharacterized protein n=1 Tax=Smallanthus sonchifolius TaxID=185202 RepID=A0ACB9C8C2_9ASTR|nr:hypothetical protein L1987_61653 [Smallanthus sonchifolius]
MSEINKSSNDINIADNDPKVEVNDDTSSKEVLNQLEKPEDNPMSSPAQEDLLTGWLQCDLDPLFKPKISALPGWLPEWLTWTKIQIMPVQWHTLGLGLFASSIAVTHRKKALSNDVCRSRL